MGVFSLSFISPKTFGAAIFCFSPWLLSRFFKALSRSIEKPDENQVDSHCKAHDPGATSREVGQHRGAPGL
jgi:hypothetical protein